MSKKADPAAEMIEAIREGLPPGVEFRPTRRGHVFCSSFCRHRGERRPEEPAPADQEQLRRLFDPSGSPDEGVRDDDWHPSPPDSPWRELDAWDTVGKRRGWYLALIERPVGH